MIIKDVHIDNYGKYSGRKFSGFTAGVNVVFGPNEHGKTTLLEFYPAHVFRVPGKKLQGKPFRAGKRSSTWGAFAMCYEFRS